MGRGRAKAKQTKVARELKYRTYDTDLGALQRELATSEDENGGSGAEFRSDESDDYDVDEPGESDEDGLAGRRTGG